GVAAADVDVVVSGVSGLRVFDEAELIAIERTVGRETPVVAPKLALGETLGAGGALAMLAAVAHLNVPANAPANVPAQSPGQGPVGHVVRGTLRSDAPVRIALVTALGYYGNASALVMRAASR
ncbi:MAG TPA: hypothetical protein VII82_02280, partial [Polyangiaceae bacterium]